MMWALLMTAARHLANALYAMLTWGSGLKIGGGRMPVPNLPGLLMLTGTDTASRTGAPTWLCC